MIYRRMPALLSPLPEAVQRYVLHFEACIEDAVCEFASSLPAGSLVLDAGAGEAQYAPLLRNHRYVGVDLGVGDAEWSYDRLDAVSNLEHLPFPDGVFDAALNIVTLEHVRDPAAVLTELSRVLRRGGSLLLATPLEWEEHQEPHDYFRYTRYGLEHLLRTAGLEVRRLQPAGGFFRLLGRRLLNTPQFFRGPASLLALVVVAAPALILPALDGFDRRKNFTLGHICVARKP